MKYTAYEDGLFLNLEHVCWHESHETRWLDVIETYLMAVGHPGLAIF